MIQQRDRRHTDHGKKFPSREDFINEFRNKRIGGHRILKAQNQAIVDDYTLLGRREHRIIH